MNSSGLFPRLAKERHEHIGSCEFPDCRLCDIIEHLEVVNKELTELGRRNDIDIRDVLCVLRCGFFKPGELAF